MKKQLNMCKCVNMYKEKKNLEKIKKIVEYIIAKILTKTFLKNV